MSARKVVERKTEPVGHQKGTSQSGLGDPLQEMYRRELDLAPFRKLKQGVKVSSLKGNEGVGATNNPVTLKVTNSFPRTGN